jgi:uncharacterized protein (DUF1499 family)
MKSEPRIFVLILITLAFLVLVSLAIWRLRVSFSSPIEPVHLDFEEVERTGKPNDYLVCPSGYCSSVADEASPVFEIPVLELKEGWLALVSEQPRTRILSNPEGLQLVFEQRSWLLNFPDTITVRFYALGERRSTIAVYSRSHYGYSDLNVNRKRVKTWLSELEKRTREGVSRDQF